MKSSKIFKKELKGSKKEVKRKKNNLIIDKIMQ